jgi:hypothetical protein
MKCTKKFKVERRWMRSDFGTQNVSAKNQNNWINER